MDYCCNNEVTIKDFAVCFNGESVILTVLHTMQFLMSKKQAFLKQMVCSIIPCNFCFYTERNCLEVSSKRTIFSTYKPIMIRADFEEIN